LFHFSVLRLEYYFVISVFLGVFFEVKKIYDPSSFLFFFCGDSLRFPAPYGAGGEENKCFGQVNGETHHLYESLPAPGVAVQRVIADLSYTLGQGAQVWDKPEDLRPEEAVDEDIEDQEEEEEQDEAVPEEKRRMEAPEAVRPMPTANLLGWSPAVRLTNEQRQVLENCGVKEEGVVDHLVWFALNNGLFESVADRVRTSADRYKCGASLHEHQSGSLTQCLFVEKEDRPVTFSRTKMYCEGSIRAAGAYQLDARMSVAARV
jgi:hypothetical protein